MKVPEDNKKKAPSSPLFSWKWWGGIGFTIVIACLAYGLALVPGIGLFGPMLLAILLAIIYRQLFGYPEKVRSGVTFSTKKILRFAIILFGFQLNMHVIFEQGLGLLAQGAIVVILAVSITVGIAKWLKSDTSFALLLGTGTGICGAAAIAAVSPIVKAKEEDTALGVGMIALAGTVFAGIYIMLYQWTTMSTDMYAAWTGLSLHEIAHVVAAADPAGQDALALALLAKLGRVFLLIPFCFALVYWLNRRQAKQSENKSTTKVAFPWFMIGFVLTSLIGTYVPIRDAWLEGITVLSIFLLTAAMVGLGLNIDFRTIGKKAWKPALALTVASVVVAVVSFAMVNMW